MIDVRIVCTHDAAQVAERLRRLLGAEDHNVDICKGRVSLHAIEASQARREAVLLIWSLDAPTQHYMLEWAQRSDPVRLVEIARTPGAPRIDGRRSPVIDFTTWSGERGNGPWRALVERLKVVARATEPAKPPPMRAMMAMGAASAMALTGAVVVRVNDNITAPEAEEEQLVQAVVTEEFAQGGAIEAIEPASEEEVLIEFTTRRLRLGELDTPAEIVLADLPGPVGEYEFQRNTMLSRITDLARPLLNVVDVMDGRNGDGDET